VGLITMVKVKPSLPLLLPFAFAKAKEQRQKKKVTKKTTATNSVIIRLEQCY